jgi:beta-lactamase superfamily II metal-dependent hydrolase
MASRSQDRFVLRNPYHSEGDPPRFQHLVDPLFLSRFPPKVAVIQCGVDNPYGHPTPETLDRLQRVGAKVFRNDEDGDVIVTIKDQELKVATTKR